MFSLSQSAIRIRGTNGIKECLFGVDGVKDVAVTKEENLKDEAAVKSGSVIDKTNRLGSSSIQIL